MFPAQSTAVVSMLGGSRSRSAVFPSVILGCTNCSIRTCRCFKDAAHQEIATVPNEMTRGVMTEFEYCYQSSIDSNCRSLEGLFSNEGENRLNALWHNEAKFRMNKAIFCHWFLKCGMVFGVLCSFTSSSALLSRSFHSSAIYFAREGQTNYFDRSVGESCFVISVK